MTGSLSRLIPPNPTASSWTNVGVGTYAISAVVTDSQGLQNTSNIATITVNAAGAGHHPAAPEPDRKHRAECDVHDHRHWDRTHLPVAIPVPRAFFPIAGATSASDTLANVTLADNGLVYECVVSNSGGSVTSQPVTLTVTSGTGGPTTLPAINPNDLPSYAGINDSLSITDYPDSNVSFVWAFGPATTNPYGAPSVIARASTANFTTSAKTASLSSYGLQAGTYPVSVYAKDSTNDVSNTLSKTITLVNSDFSQVKVYPNPWRKDKHDGQPVTFANLPIGSTVKIFTVSGHKVKVLDATSGGVTWDLTNEGGDKVASGIYVYLITTGDTGYGGNGQKVRGKLAVVK